MTGWVFPVHPVKEIENTNTINVVVDICQFDDKVAICLWTYLRAIDIGHFVCWQDADMRCPGVFWRDIVVLASQRQSVCLAQSEHCLLLSFGRPSIC